MNPASLFGLVGTQAVTEAWEKAAGCNHAYYTSLSTDGQVRLQQALQWMHVKEKDKQEGWPDSMEELTKEQFLKVLRTELTTTIEATGSVMNMNAFRELANKLFKNERGQLIYENRIKFDRLQELDTVIKNVETTQGCDLRPEQVTQAINAFCDAIRESAKRELEDGKQLGRQQLHQLLLKNNAKGAESWPVLKRMFVVQVGTMQMQLQQVSGNAMGDILAEMKGQARTEEWSESSNRDEKRPKKKQKKDGREKTFATPGARSHLCNMCGRVGHSATDCLWEHHPDANKEDRPFAESTVGKRTKEKWPNHERCVLNARWTLNAQPVERPAGLPGGSNNNGKTD